MSDLYQSLSHSKWDCKYHVVFISKRRRKVVFGKIRPQLGEIFHALAQQKECQILKGHLMPDHVHRCIAIPPKHPVASVIGFLKGKSALAVARLSGRERSFTGEHFWARKARRALRDALTNNPTPFDGARLIKHPHRRWCLTEEWVQSDLCRTLGS